MNRIISFILVFTPSLFIACSNQDSTLNWKFVNNSGLHVEFLYPAQHNKSTPFQWGNMKDLAPDDTTMRSAGNAHFGYNHLLPYSLQILDSGFNSLEEMCPYDTVRIFVYDGSYHYEKPHPYYDHMKYCEAEEYYCRYDISKENIQLLIKDNNQIEICFPPDYRMKTVKMWPPYDTIINIFVP